MPPASGLENWRGKSGCTTNYYLVKDYVVFAPTFVQNNAF